MAGRTRERILEAADRLFYERGITASGVDAISAEAAVAKSTLYQHFRSKDALVEAYLRARSESWHAQLADELDGRAGDGRGRLLAVFDVLAQAVAAPGFLGCPFIRAAGEVSDRDGPARRVAVEHREGLRSLLYGLAREAGERRPSELADRLELLVDGAMVTAQIECDASAPASARIAAESLIDAAGGPGPRSARSPGVGRPPRGSGRSAGSR